MERTSQLKKGKSAEFLVFAELLKRDADLYLPIVDIGIDAIIKKKDGTYLQIQVKSTEADEQAGYFNVDDINEHPKENYFIICVDMNKEKSKIEGKPNIWILTAKDFKEYMVAGHRLPIYERSHKHNNEVRCELLKDNFEAWHLLTG